ncbi:MAG: hypothetical protein Q8P49_00460, partial [Candidatus Liptonbacteria bacterium]|nr:hypothetical protein [Candidatus Liptonbacteria bacterium]
MKKSGKPRRKYVSTPTEKMGLVRALLIGTNRSYNEDCRAVNQSNLPDAVKNDLIKKIARLYWRKVHAAMEGKNPYTIENKNLRQAIEACKK